MWTLFWKTHSESHRFLHSTSLHAFSAFSCPLTNSYLLITVKTNCSFEKASPDCLHYSANLHCMPLFHIHWNSLYRLADSMIPEILTSKHKIIFPLKQMIIHFCWMNPCCSDGPIHSCWTHSDPWMNRMTSFFSFDSQTFLEVTLLFLCLLSLQPLRNSTFL